MALPKRFLALALCVATAWLRSRGEADPSLGKFLAKPRELDARTAKQLVDSADAFVFDLDGVIWIGGTLVDGVKEALAELRTLGKAVVFATNNAMRTRAEVAYRLKSLGLDWVMEADVFNSANAVARLLEARGIPKDREIYVVGEAGLRDELRAVGYRTRGGPEDAGRSYKEISGALEFIDANRTGAVVCGLDQHLNYYKVAIASHLIRKGVPFFASNDDLYGQVGGGSHQWPGAGSVLAALAAASGRRPPVADAVAGKPNLEFAEMIRHALDVPSYEKMVMVGDRLDTDVLFGSNAGMRTLLVLSGVTSRADVRHARGALLPDYFASSVAALRV